MKKIVSIINLKGGVAKTTTAVNFAYELANRGQRVLIVDNDKQGNLSKAFKSYDPFNKYTTAYLMTKRDADVSKVIAKTRYENIDIIPANMHLANANMSVMMDIVAAFKEDTDFFDIQFFKKIYGAYCENLKEFEKSGKDLYELLHKIYDCFEDINGCLEEFDYKGEHIEVLYAGQSARFMCGDIDEQIVYKDMAEVAYAMILTKMITFDDAVQEVASKQDESKDELSKEISSLKQDLDKYYEYLTDIEKRTIQDILTAAAERGGGRL